MMPQDSDAELERLLLEGVSLTQETVPSPEKSYNSEVDDVNSGVWPGGDIQGALGLFAEAAQDMATAGLELALGRHFACADYCNQVAEKAAQSVSLLRFGRQSMYNHDLRALGELVGAPEEIQKEMAILTPFHPETFYAETPPEEIQEELAILTPFHPESFYAGTPPEEADEVISAEQANSYVQSARHVLRWARTIILNV